MRSAGVHEQEKIMQTITEIRPDIFRLTIPFEDIYTTVFFIRTAAGYLLFDTATYDSDIFYLPWSSLGSHRTN